MAVVNGLKNRWTRLDKNDEMGVDDNFNRQLVTIKFPDNRLKVKLSYPGWNRGGLLNVIAYKSTEFLPWKSEYKGDTLPEKDGWYLVKMQYKFSASNFITIGCVLYNAKKQEFYCDDRYEVMAFCEMPLPYRKD